MRSVRNRLTRKLFKLCAAILLTGVCWGCATGSSGREQDELGSQADSIKAIKADMLEAQHRSKTTAEEGSLWEEDNYLSGLFRNQKARQIGDIVTIKIVESSKATNKASTQTGRSSDLSAGVANFFGAENEYSSSSPFFNPFGSVGGSFDSDFKGDGTTQRSGDLTAYLSARVVDVLPNGNIVVTGSREVMVNNEKQQITLSGIVRPADISADNQVESTFISDAKISYNGKGVLDDSQSPGWLVRTLDKVWPF
jgi:flagellar L-ring protein FlgH